VDPHKLARDVGQAFEPDVHIPRTRRVRLERLTRLESEPLLPFVGTILASKEGSLGLMPTSSAAVTVAPIMVDETSHGNGSPAFGEEVPKNRQTGRN